MSPLDNDALCPGCDKPVGDHTIRGYAECLKTAEFDYELPYEEDPAGGVKLPGIDGSIAGEVSVAGAVVTSVLGPLPALQFRFTGVGTKPMERVAFPAITLLMDERGIEAVGQLVAKAVRSACEAARRAS